MSKKRQLITGVTMFVGLVAVVFTLLCLESGVVGTLLSFAVAVVLGAWIVTGAAFIAKGLKR